MGIDARKIIADIVDKNANYLDKGHCEWVVKTYYYDNTGLESEGFVAQSLIELIELFNANISEKKTNETYDFYYFKDPLEKPVESKEFLLKNATKANLKNNNPIPGFKEAVDEFNKLMEVLGTRPATKYESLKESKFSDKKPINNFNTAWFKSFKNFKKSGITVP